VRVGSKGPTVRAVQEELEIGADGIFGRGTEAHVKVWQEANGLTADGIMGPSSLKLMFGD
jgi:N-acetylmuramoyl-L-alanine amidase